MASERTPVGVGTGAAAPPGAGGGCLTSNASVERVGGEPGPQRVTAVTPTRAVAPSTSPNQAALLWHWWLVGVHVIGPA